ncbi:uncharacterized protein LOC134779444 isoform X2 [Penaeus indicus]|uniref:uncharacterized protein LOC134779444 isoform X2 n=1 Tax=Penaeus indicus TaxID=29960 RepID=UPI00300BFDE1
MVRWRSGMEAAVLVALVALAVPTPASATDTQADSIAAVLREVTGQLERFNTLYINKLERELSSSTAKIAALESAVRSIGDRAAAWDNIQNHMTVWTDQSRTMERKLDLLNRCHEKQDTWEVKLNAVDALNHKLTALDKKINAMTRLEFKVEQVSERVEEVNSKVNWVKKQMAAPEQPIITEFAGRGLLSSLVQIESKLENISSKLPSMGGGNGGNGGNGGGSGGGYSAGSGGGGVFSSFKRPRVYGSRFRQLRPTVEPEPGIHFTNGDDANTCQLHPRDSRRLQDVSAKVDLLFDRITDPDYDYDYFVSHMPRPSSLNSQSSGSNGGSGAGEGEASPEHLFARFWKSMFSPFKKMNRKIRVFENQLAAVQKSCNTSFSMEGYAAEVGGVLQKKLMPLDEALREEMLETRVAVNDQAANIEKVSQAVGNTAYMGEQLLSEIKNQFHAQRVIIQERFDETRGLILQYCGNGGGGGGGSGGRPPYNPPAAPRSPSYPTTPVPSKPSIPVFPTTRLKKVRNRHNRVHPDAEPEIHTLQGGRGHRFKYRYKYRYNDPLQRALVQSHRQVSKVASRPQSAQARRGKIKGYRQSASHEDTPHDMAQPESQSRMSPKRQQSQGLSDQGSAGRLGRSANDQKPTASEVSDIRDCTDLLSQGYKRRIVFNFNPDSQRHSDGHDYFHRYCDQETAGGGWTVIQRRGMFGPPFYNFTKSWRDYKLGFGDLSQEFWWGNDNIYRMVRSQDTVIRFDLWDFEGNYAYAEYLSFSIGPESDNYRLSVFDYRGNASDSFSAHNGYLFSTVDRDNDEAPDCCPCAPAYGGGWWFYSCFESNLNGDYFTSPKDNDYYRGIIWELWLGDYSLKATEIKIRPASFSGGVATPDLPYPPTPIPDPYPTETLEPELPLRQPVQNA